MTVNNFYRYSTWSTLVCPKAIFTYNPYKFHKMSINTTKPNPVVYNRIHSIVHIRSTLQSKNLLVTIISQHEIILRNRVTIQVPLLPWSTINSHSTQTITIKYMEQPLPPKKVFRTSRPLQPRRHPPSHSAMITKLFSIILPLYINFPIRNVYNDKINS